MSGIQQFKKIHSRLVNSGKPIAELMELFHLNGKLYVCMQVITLQLCMRLLILENRTQTALLILETGLKQHFSIIICISTPSISSVKPRWVSC